MSLEFHHDSLKVVSLPYTRIAELHAREGTAGYYWLQ